MRVSRVCSYTFAVRFSPSPPHYLFKADNFSRPLTYITHQGQVPGARKIANGTIIIRRFVSRSNNLWKLATIIIYQPVQFTSTLMGTHFTWSTVQLYLSFHIWTKKKKKNSNYNLWSKNPTEVGAFNYYLALPVASVSHSWGQKKNLLHLTSLASHRIVFFSQRSCIHYVIHEHLKPQAAVTSTENLQGRKLKEWGKQC